MKSISLKINDRLINAELAVSDKDRQKGLMGRLFLSDNSGMLFVFDKPDILSFWMRNTSLPLSIAFISETGEILNIEDMAPFNEAKYKSRSNAMFALEMNQGWFSKNRIHDGDIVAGLDNFLEPDHVDLTELKKIIRETLYL